MDQLRNNQNESKGNRKTQEVVRGSVLLVLGAWMSMGCIRVAIYIWSTQNFGPWIISDTMLRLVSAAFFIWVGARAIRRLGQDVPGTRVGWGRLLLGVVFIYIQIRDHFVPNPDALRPDNAGEAVGMQIMRTVFWIAGVALIFAAFLKKRPQGNSVARTADASVVQEQELP